LRDSTTAAVKNSLTCKGLTVEINNSSKDKIISLYRAVGADEFRSIIRTKQFDVLEHGLHVKHFGLNFEETLEFANKNINVDAVAIFEITILETIIRKIGDFTHVDPYIFKSGTVEITSDNLDAFNKAIIRITHNS